MVEKISKSSFIARLTGAVLLFGGMVYGINSYEPNPYLEPKFFTYGRARKDCLEGKLQQQSADLDGDYINDKFCLVNNPKNQDELIGVGIELNGKPKQWYFLINPYQ